MTYSEQDRYHIAQVRGRIEGGEAIAVFDQLLGWAEGTRGIFVYPLARGSFSAIYLGTRPAARKYADCPFGLLGARHHVRWLFRKPCFDAGLCDTGTVQANFDGDMNALEGEVAVNLHNPAEGEAMIAFLNPRVSRG